MNFRKTRISPEFTAVWIILFLITINLEISAQWTGNIHTNKLLVTGCRNPINLNTVSDLDGGGFIFWQDKIDSVKSGVFFQYFDNEGIQNFKTDGQPVSISGNDKIQPLAAELLNNSAVVLWKENAPDNTSDLFIQRVADNGELLWGSYGVSVTKRQGEEKNPSLTTDSDGNVFIGYTYEDYNLPGNYGIYVQRFNNSGVPFFKENGIMIYRSQKIKNQPVVKADEKGGCYIFWLESNDGKNYLYALHIDSSGQFNWGKKPVLVSSLYKNISNYNVVSVAGAFAYMVWEINFADRDIFHQLISRNGKFVWKKGGEIVTGLPGSQSSPHAFYSDSTITVSWVNDIKNSKVIYAQKFTVRGKPLWGKDGIAITGGKGTKTGQRIISDKFSGAYLVWFDKPVPDKAGPQKEKSLSVKIMAQRISKEGKKLWDSTGVEVASSPNSEKSYLFLLPAKTEGAIAVFKDKRSGKNNIYGQKILTSGRFIFELLSFNAAMEKELVKLSWQTKNEQDNKGFYVERSTSDTNWQKIRFIPGQNLDGICSYEFIDHPTLNGVNYYRLVQVDNDNLQQKSNVLQINYVNADAENYALMQNIPNPFSDSTYIRYYLPEESEVELEIFNDKIETILQLVGGVQAKGEYSIVFYTKTEEGKLPDGIYYYRLKALPVNGASAASDGQFSSFVDVKKMVISR